ncbi:High-affinity nicotinic acid transporter [Cystobasidiomycetes sp. EMM_F5]
MSSEKDLCTQRYEANTGEYSATDKLEFKYVRAAWTDITTYTHGIAQFGIDVALYGISTFMPIFISDFGYSTVTSQILTVPVYFVAAISFVIQAYFSDKLKKRGIFILGNMFVTLVGYIILCSVGNPSGVRYFALFIVALGMYAPVGTFLHNKPSVWAVSLMYGFAGLNVGWTQANHSPHYKRAAAVGLMQLVGNSSGAAIGFIYMDGPRYAKGFGIAIAVHSVAMMSIGFMLWYYNWRNAQKRAAVAAGAKDQPELGDKNPHYLYML